MFKTWYRRYGHPTCVFIIGHDNNVINIPQYGQFTQVLIILVLVDYYDVYIYMISSNIPYHPEIPMFHD